jgi:hypothetical protein
MLFLQLLNDMSTGFFSCGNREGTTLNTYFRPVISSRDADKSDFTGDTEAFFRPAPFTFLFSSSEVLVNSAIWASSSLFWPRS